MGWIYVDQDKDQWRISVNVIFKVALWISLVTFKI
jgi:hypothetical protein